MPKCPQSEPGGHRRGSTLVEVLVASLLLAIMAIGTAAYLTHARAGTLTQRNKRVALEAANKRLEELRAAVYDEVKPLAEDYDTHYLSPQGAFWLHTDTDPDETVDVNGLTLPLTTTVQYQDIDGGSASYDYVLVTASTGYRLNQDEQVTLETYLAP